MTVLPHKIARDLSGEIRGDVLVDPPARAIYSSAACIYRVMPLAVVRPLNAEDVAKTTQYAAVEGIPLTARGGGSAVAGQTLGAGIIVDFSKFMAAILQWGDDWVEVEPGVVLDRLNEHLAPMGKRFAPDPSSSAYCAIGGMLANNSSGARGLKFGATRRHVKSVEFVNSDGKLVDTASDNAWMRKIRLGIGRIVERYSGHLEERCPKVTKNSSGYGLWEDAGAPGDMLKPIVAHNGDAIARLLVGSEGTLGLIVKARLKTVPLPPVKGAVLLAFPSLQAATEAAPLLRDTSASAIEIMDAFFLDIARRGRPDLAELLPEGGRSLLLVEHEAEDGDQLRAFQNDAISAAEKTGGRACSPPAGDESAIERLWAVRKAASPIISSMGGSRRPVRFVEDMVVPPERFADFADKFMGILEKYDCLAPVIGHAGEGNIHVNPLLDLNDPDSINTLHRVADAVYGMVGDFDGSLTGEHGDGRLRTPYLKQFWGDGVYDAFGEIKGLFDPKDLFNPGIIWGDGAITDNIKHGKPPVKTGSSLDEPAARDITLRCHGCGDCRNSCPIHNIDGVEEMTPRARLNLAMAIMEGVLPMETSLTHPAFQAAINSCLGCARCEAECPSGVDVTAIISRMREIMPERGMAGLRDKMLSRPRKTFERMARWQVLLRLMMKTPALGRAIYGLARLNPENEIPPFDKAGLAPYSVRYRLETRSPDVLYFPGCYGRFIDPGGVERAVMFALEKMGLKTRIPSAVCCGLPMAAYGDRTGAARSLARVINELNNYPETPVITSCPSCSRMLRGKAFGMGGPPGMGRVAERLQSAEQFFCDNLEGVVDMKPLDAKVALHRPCHQRGGAEFDAARQLLESIPGVELTILPDLCCSMGGAFGFKAENAEWSKALKSPLLDAIINAKVDMAASSCGSCNMVINQAAKTLHPVTLLARALGLNANSGT